MPMESVRVTGGEGRRNSWLTGALGRVHSLAGLAGVGAERPPVSFGIAHSENAGPVAGAMHSHQDLAPGRRGPGGHRIRLAGDHVSAEPAGLQGPLVAVAGPLRPEHDAA